MQIAQLAPPAERVPPALYGGTERVVSALTEELVRRGHEVTLFASGDSRTAAALVPVCARALRLDPTVADANVYTMRELGRAFARAGEFDLIHSHLDYYALPFAALTRTPVVTTLHGRLDLPDLPAIFGDYPTAPLVSVSNSQRAPLRRANWAATIYNGVDLRSYRNVRTAPGDYFAFIGRISPEKNVEAAVEIARRTGIPLKIAAKVDQVDAAYYEQIVRPLIDGRFIEYLGEIGEAEKNVFLGGARALLFPIRWPEPFGLAMTEAMASGTPVLAMRNGTVPEVVVDGETASFATRWTSWSRSSRASPSSTGANVAGTSRCASVPRRWPTVMKPSTEASWRAAICPRLPRAGRGATAVVAPPPGAARRGAGYPAGIWPHRAVARCDRRLPPTAASMSPNRPRWPRR